MAAPILRQKSGLRHHRDARTLRPRTFLNTAFWLWYFWVAAHPNNENRLDVIPFPRIPRRTRGPRRRRTRRRARAHALSDGDGRQRDRRAPAGGRTGHQGHGHNVHGLPRAGRLHRPRLAARHHPAHHLPQGVAEDRGGADPARRRAQPVHRRRLPRAEIHQGRPDAGLDHRDLEELPRQRARASNRRSAPGRTSAART